MDDYARHVRLLNDERNSLLYWYPKVKDMVPTPRTKIVEIEDPLDLLEEVPEDVLTTLREHATELGYPLFVRTDTFSGKHHFVDTCYVKSEERLAKNVRNLVEWSFFHDLIPRAICLREFLELDWKFKAFSGLPIATEVRVMARDGEVEKWFFYWPDDAIRRPTKKNWRNLLREMWAVVEREQEVFLKQAEKVARKFDDYWSIDFARARDGTWYLIDMALGDVSWTPERM